MTPPLSYLFLQYMCYGDKKQEFINGTLESWTYEEIIRGGNPCSKKRTASGALLGFVTKVSKADSETIFGKKGAQGGTAPPSSAPATKQGLAKFFSSSTKIAIGASAVEPINKAVSSSSVALVEKVDDRGPQGETQGHEAPYSREDPPPNFDAEVWAGLPDDIKLSVIAEYNGRS
jgi:hypothetical protein